jgi:hypothetical protein
LRQLLGQLPESSINPHGEKGKKKWEENQNTLIKREKKRKKREQQFRSKMKQKRRLRALRSASMSFRNAQKKTI